MGVYRWHDKYTCPDATTVTREGPAVLRGQLVVLDTLYAIDYTTADKTLIVGIKGVDGGEHYIRKVDIANHYSCFLNGKLILLPGEKPIGKVETPTTSDVLYFTAHGLIYEYPEG